MAMLKLLVPAKHCIGKINTIKPKPRKVNILIDKINAYKICHIDVTKGCARKLVAPLIPCINATSGQLEALRLCDVARVGDRGLMPVAAVGLRFGHCLNPSVRG